MTIINLTPPTEGSIDLTPLAATEVLLAPVGPAGPNGWSPRLTIVNDGTRRVFQVSDWIGGSGTKPATGLYVGSSGLVSSIGSAVDVRGPIGITGDRGWSAQLAIVSDGVRRVLQIDEWVGGQGTPPAAGRFIGAPGVVATAAEAVDIRGAAGLNGWSPEFAIENDGTRRVLKVVDWEGGTGTKPAVDLYVGATGLVADIASAVDIRGTQGPPGPGTGDVVGPATAVDGELAVFDGATGKLIKSGGSLSKVSDAAFIYFMRWG